MHRQTHNENSIATTATQTLTDTQIYTNQKNIYIFGSIFLSVDFIQMGKWCFFCLNDRNNVFCFTLVQILDTYPSMPPK